MALEALNTVLSSTTPHTSSFSLGDKHELDKYAKGKRTKRPRTVEAQFMTDEEYIAFCLVMLAQGSSAEQPRHRVTSSHDKILPPPGKESPEQLSHKCSVCGRCFSSYQALGGHKASHRDGGDKNSNGGNKSKSAGDGAGKSRHECSVCRRCFPTGQALGGHMRRHYEGGNKNNSTGVDTSSASGLTHLKGFDLNFPPALGGGDDDVEVESPHPLKKRLRLSLFDI